MFNLITLTIKLTVHLFRKNNLKCLLLFLKYLLINLNLLNQF